MCILYRWIRYKEYIQTCIKNGRKLTLTLKMFHSFYMVICCTRKEPLVCNFLNTLNMYKSNGHFIVKHIAVLQVNIANSNDTNDKTVCCSFICPSVCQTLVLFLVAAHFVKTFRHLGGPSF